MKTQYKPLPDLSEREGENTDQWVERIGVMGAMMIHPWEFEVDEIIEELEAYGVEAMRVGMAYVIRCEYNLPDEIEELKGFTKTAVSYAWEF